jgi:hypothetical protein
MTAKVTDTLGNQMKPKEQVSPGVVREIRPGVIQAKHVLPYSWDGEEQLVFPVYLVEDIITESTIGLMVAESTGGKTFTATDMAYAIGLGLPFFGKDTERGGVIYVAAEAPGTIPIRQKAAREHRALPLVSMLGHHVEDGLTMEQASRLPVVTITDVPNLSTPAGVNDLIATIQEIAVGMEERHGLPIKLIIIDTVLAAFCVEDWNSAGQTTAVTDTMKKINKATNAAVMGLAHHGKDISRGPAGSFALKANVDFLITLIVKHVGNDVLQPVESRHLIVTKSRDGQEGWQCEFKLESVFMGKNRKGKDIYTAVLVPVLNGSRLMSAAKGKKASRDRPLEIFQESFVAVPTEAIRIRGDGPEVKSVRRNLVRAEFEARYTTDDGKKGTITRAFTRALDSARSKWKLYEGKSGGHDWFWRLPDKESEGQAGQTGQCP